MKTKAVRLYGADDLRLEEFELPELKDDEILMKVICDSVCMSTHKATGLGEDHYLVNDDIATNPSIIGHEFTGELIEVGANWQDKYKVGDAYTVQVTLSDLEYGIAGYSMPYFGGSATYVIVPSIMMEEECLLPLNKEYGFFNGSLAEPVSCNISTFHSMFHSKRGVYEHIMGIRKNGRCAMLGSCGPMGLAGIGYLLNCDRRPKAIVVVDANQAKLDRAKSIFTEEYGQERGVKLSFVNLSQLEDPQKDMRKLAGIGFDDIVVYPPVKELVELADSLLAMDGCLNFFSGPLDKNFKAEMNFYNVHYSGTHVVGTTGGTTADMREYLDMCSEGKLNASFMITHIGGLNATADTVLNLPKIPGGKKLIYNHIDMELTALEDFAEKGKTDPIFKTLAEITEAHGGLWCKEAEDYLLSHK